MVIEDIFVAVEQVTSKLVGTEWNLSLFRLLLFLPFPLDVVGSVVWVSHIFDGLEVVRNDSRLDIGLKLAWLRFHSSVFLSESFRVFLWVSLLFVFVRGFVEGGIGGCGVKLLLMDL